MSTSSDREARLGSWSEIEKIDPATPIEIAPSGGWYAVGKTLFDYCVALVLLIPALPLIAICWALVRLTSSGPGFYVQSRLGRDGKSYKIIKLRTMDLNAEVTGATWAIKNDSRVTRIGKFLRATHLDELPQLFNVLAGDMSLVGPRPERSEIIVKKGLNDLVPGFKHRLLVKPGITGIAQIQLPPDSDVMSVRFKVVYDLYYIQNTSFWLDLRILTATLFKSTGLSPVLLQRIFFLPARSRVLKVFVEDLLPPPAPSAIPSSSFQPA